MEILSDPTFSVVEMPSKLPEGKLTAREAALAKAKAKQAMQKYASENEKKLAHADKMFEAAKRTCAQARGAQSGAALRRRAPWLE